MMIIEIKEDSFHEMKKLAGKMLHAGSELMECLERAGEQGKRNGGDMNHRYPPMYPPMGDYRMGYRDDGGSMGNRDGGMGYRDGGDMGYRDDEGVNYRRGVPGTGVRRY